jgi:hypothetical protein
LAEYNSPNTVKSTATYLSGVRRKDEIKCRLPFQNQF